MAISLISSANGYLGDLYSDNYGTLSIDGTGADYLLFFMMNTHQIVHDPSVSYAGIPLTKRAETLKTTEGELSVWELKYPKTGINDLRIIVYDPGYPVVDSDLLGPSSGIAMMYSGLSESISVILQKDEGTSFTKSISSIVSTDKLYVPFFQIYGVSSTPSVSGWADLSRSSSTYIDANLYEKTSSSGTVTFDGSNSEYRFFHYGIIKIQEGTFPIANSVPLTKTIEIKNSSVFVTGGVDTSGSNVASLDFDFRNPGSLPLNVTFTRSSTSTYIDSNGDEQIADINVPAWTYDESGNLRGLRNEESTEYRASDNVILQLVEGVYVVTITREDGTISFLPDTELPWNYIVPKSNSPLQYVKIQSPGGPTDGSGIGGVVEAIETFDCNGGDLLLVALTYPSEPPPPSITFDGVSLKMLENFENILSPNDAPHVGRMVLYSLSNPPNGPKQLRVWDNDRYIGQIIIHCISVKNSSGVIGAKTIKSPWQINPEMHFDSGVKPGSLVLIFESSLWSREGNGFYINADSPYTELSYDSGPYGKGYLWKSTTSEGISSIFLHRNPDVHGWIQLLGIELYPELNQLPDLSGQTSHIFSDISNNIICDTYLPEATNQKSVIYYDTWSDTPNVWGINGTRINLSSARNINDYQLVKIPPYIDRVILHASAPLYTYSGYDSNVQETTGLSWSGSAIELKNAINLLKERNKNIQVLVSIMQLYREGGGGIYATSREPYNEFGFGGMTNSHWQSIKLFIDDMGIDGIDIDYECGSIDVDVSKHCWTNADGTRSCYTDAELVDVVKTARFYLPREDGYILTIAAWHVGCYGERNTPFTNSKPGGWGAGGNICLSRDLDARNAIDGIHIMTYDAGTSFDPVEALKSYQYYFPDTPCFIGLRLGTKEWGPSIDQMPRRNMDDFMQYINASIEEDSGGAFIYSMFWDFAEPSAERYSSSGKYGWEYPNSNMAAPFLGKRYNHKNTDVPLVGRRNISRNKVLNSIIKPKR